MNATVGTDSNGSWSYLGTNNDDRQTNDNGSRLLSLTEECHLYIMNSLYDSKPIHRQTWYSPSGFAKRIDYILAEWHIKKLSSNCVCLFDNAAYIYSYRYIPPLPHYFSI